MCVRVCVRLSVGSVLHQDDVGKTSLSSKLIRRDSEVLQKYSCCRLNLTSAPTGVEVLMVPVS